MKQEEIPQYLLSKEYVLEHGMPDDKLEDAYYIERIMDYERGCQDGFLKLYYANGKLREHYRITKEGQEIKHFWWYPNGVLKRAVLYLPDGKNKKTIVFDTSGNVISQRFWNGAPKLCASLTYAPAKLPRKLEAFRGNFHTNNKSIWSGLG